MDTQTELRGANGRLADVAPPVQDLSIDRPLGIRVDSPKAIALQSARDHALITLGLELIGAAGAKQAAGLEALGLAAEARAVRADADRVARLKRLFSVQQEFPLVDESQLRAGIRARIEQYFVLRFEALTEARPQGKKKVARADRDRAEAMKALRDDLVDGVTAMVLPFVTDVASIALFEGLARSSMSPEYFAFQGLEKMRAE